MSLPPKFISYECWSAEGRRAIDNWDRVQEQLEKGPPLSWTAPRGERPDVPTREAYVEMLRRDAYDCGYTAGREAERKAVTERALRTERQEKVRQIMKDMGFTANELRELLDSEDGADDDSCQCSMCCDDDDGTRECPYCRYDGVDDDGWCAGCGDHV